MRRPLCVFCVGTLGVELLCAFLPQAGLLLPLAAVFVFLLILLIFIAPARKTALTLLLGGLLGLALAGTARNALETVQSQYAGSTTYVRAQVERVSASYWEGHVRAVLWVEQADGAATGFRCEAACLPECAAGDIVEVRLTLETPARARELDLYADAISLTAEDAFAFRVVGRSGSFRARTSRLQARLSAALQQLLDEDTGGVLSAMVVGDRTALPADLNRAYRSAGLSHVLVVSGMHVSILCGGGLPALRRKRERSYASRRLGAVFRAGMALLLVGVTGFTPSVLRAAVAVWVSALGVWLYAPADGLTSLAVAGLLMTMGNSYAVCDVGFELSFASVLGILAGTELLRRWQEKRQAARDAEWAEGMPPEGPHRLAVFLGRMKYSLWETACISLCASAATFPVLVLRGMSVSLYSLLSGAAVLWLVQPMMTLGLAAALAGLFSAAGPLHVVCSFCAGALAYCLNGWARMVAGWPGAQLGFDTAYAALVCLLIWGLCWLAYRLRVRMRVAVPAVLFTAAVALGAGNALSRGIVQVELTGTAQAPAVVITQDGQAIVLFRGGASAQDAVETLLRYRGAEEVAFLADLRMTPETPCTLPAERSVSAAEMEPYTSRALSVGDIRVELLRTRTGCIVRLLVDGRRLVTLSGTVELAKPIRADWLLASPARPDSVRWSGLLSLSGDYRWMEEGFQTQGRTLWLRPGGGTRTG